jgi:hypothetical protein
LAPFSGAEENRMMLALYVVLGWSLAGFVAAVLMGRAIAACSGEQSEAVLATAERPACPQTTKSFPAAEAA